MHTDRSSSSPPETDVVMSDPITPKPSSENIPTPLLPPPSATNVIDSAPLHSLSMLTEQEQSDRPTPLQGQFLNSEASTDAIGSLPVDNLDNAMISSPSAGPATGGSVFTPQDPAQQDISISSVQGSSSASPSILPGAALGGAFTSFETTAMSATNSPPTNIVGKDMAKNYNFPQRRPLPVLTIEALLL